MGYTNITKGDVDSSKDGNQFTDFIKLVHFSRNDVDRCENEKCKLGKRLNSSDDRIRKA